MNTDFLDTVQAAKRLGLKKSTLDTWRCRGDGPPFVKMGRAVRYRTADLERWVESRVMRNTIAAPAEGGAE